MVDADGTYMLHGVRVRAGPGSGGVPGCIYDEMEAGVRTPFADEKARKTTLGLLSHADVIAFARSLPSVRLVPVGSSDGARDEDDEA
jgi:hypothetical protein